MKKILLQTPEQAYKWIKKVIGLSPIAVDTETQGLKWEQLVLEGISFCTGREAVFIDFTLMNKSEKDYVFRIMRKLFEQPVTFIFHNAVFDIKVLMKSGFRIRHEKIFCTKIAAYLLNENRVSTSLKKLAISDLKIEKDKVQSWEQAKAKSKKEFANYGMNDAIWTYMLYQKYTKQLKKEKLEKVFYEIEMPFRFVLAELETNGILFDIKKYGQYKQKLEEQLRMLLIKLLEVGNIPYLKQHTFSGTEEIVPTINLDSPEQLGQFIVKKLKIKLPKTITGKYTTGVYTLEKIRNKHKFIKLLLKYRKLSKLYNSFFDKLTDYVDKDGRIRANFSYRMAVTGRVISSNPNLQQLPRRKENIVDIRECFIAPKGKRLIAADYSGQELRVLTHITKDKNLISAFFKGQDIHQMVADRIKRDRSSAKNVVFGICYGQREKGLAERLNITEKEAKKIIGKFLGEFPAISKAIEKCEKKIEDKYYVRDIEGRKRRFDYSSSKAKRQAFNFLIQGTSAEMMKRGAIAIRKLAKKFSLWDLKLVLTVHDELVYEVRKEWVKHAIPLIKKKLEEAMDLIVPLKVDIKSGRDYSQAKGKIS